MDWYCGDFNGLIAPGTGNIQCDWLILPSELHEQTTDPTLMATRVALAAEVAGGGTLTNNESIVALGIIAWNYVDDTIPTPCPGPLRDCDADWIYWWAAPGVPTTSGVFHTNGGADTNILSKARRRLGNDQSLLIAVESLVQSYNFHLHARCLIKE